MAHSRCSVNSSYYNHDTSKVAETTGFSSTHARSGCHKLTGEGRGAGHNLHWDLLEVLLACPWREHRVSRVPRCLPLSTSHPCHRRAVKGQSQWPLRGPQHRDKPASCGTMATAPRTPMRSHPGCACARRGRKGAGLRLKEASHSNSPGGPLLLGVEAPDASSSCENGREGPPPPPPCPGSRGENRSQAQLLALKPDGSAGEKKKRLLCARAWTVTQTLPRKESQCPSGEQGSF